MRCAPRSMAATSPSTLLDGVTGSGKTRGLFRGCGPHAGEGPPGADHAAGDRAHQPVHGSLRPAASAAAPVEWHSALSAPERGRAWRAAATGEARVVVGARSALFLPFSDLGLIVVDEEHDQGFKQEDRVHYQARDMAVVRASLGKFPVVLASATPSIESHVNARTGRYRACRRCRGAFPAPSCPTCHAIDMRSDRPTRAVAGARSWSRPSPRRWRGSSRPCCSSTGAATRR